MPAEPLPSDPARLSARAAAAAVRAGRLSPGELAEACLKRIAAREPELRAWAALAPDTLRAAAAASGRAGPLAGLPVGIKDIIATADYPTACGSPIHAGRRTGGDASAVALLRAAGGLVAGKTATTEFAAYQPAGTRNPLNPAHTPGGSSSGSAAAVADCHVPLALGTQTAGSVIRPASFCGIVGFKPTFGTLDLAGVQPFASSLDTLGVFARDVADAALLVGALAGWPALVALAEAPDHRTDRPGAAPAPGRAPARVRVVRAPGWEAATPAARDALDRAAGVFADAGIPVDHAPLPDGFEALAALQERLQVTEGSRALAHERLAHGVRLSENLRSQLGRALSFADYRRDRLAQIEWAHRVDGLIGEGEVWLTASAPGEAPRGLGSTGDPVFCRAWTLLGTPAVTLPNGRGPAGLPLGTQLVAGRFGDAGLLAAALWLEARLG